MTSKNFSNILLDSKLKNRISSLSITQLEELAEALLDFSSRDDLLTWLETHAPES
ncbi:MAG: DUF4351 domain-containing protein [Nostocaceae cyanobacterium]|nr:DUF4351 domain-containing protein [Nostocaceae cyanobacterium]